MEKLDPEEVRERHLKLAKMRSKEFYNLIKLKHQSKIKSKNHRKHLRKQQSHSKDLELQKI